MDRKSYSKNIDCFMNDIEDMKMKTIVVDGMYLGEEYFDNINTTFAKVVFGKVIREGGIFWNSNKVETQLHWRKNCNLKGEEGIASDNGTGWAGWDETFKCYLNYNSNIKNNENAMKIIEIEQNETKTNLH